MRLSRRDFLELMLAAGAAGALARPGKSLAGSNGSNDWRAIPEDFYDVPRQGNVHLLHFCDLHGQLKPVYFREPNINLGLHDFKGKPPLLVGEELLRHYQLDRFSPAAHAFTHLDFRAAAEYYGRVGGAAHLATAVQRARDERPGALLLDSGDTWHGSGPALWSEGRAMVEFQKKLGVDACTGHWEFIYGDERVQELVADLDGAGVHFLAQNVLDRDWLDPIFDAYSMHEENGVPVAVVGQAFPFTPIANPGYLFPQWEMGHRLDRLQEQVDRARDDGAQVVVLLSHAGMLTDMAYARQLRGVDVILGGHTHDPVPYPEQVEDADGESTLVVNSGSNGKHLSVLDLDVRDGRIRDFHYRNLPIFSNALEPDPDMQSLVDEAYAPYEDKLSEVVGEVDGVLYRRGNFNGTFDEVLAQALIEGRDAEVAFTPGFRWGPSVLPGKVTFEDCMNQTCSTYSETTRNEMTGEAIKHVLEDVANSIFNEDPMLHRGGDMVRSAGLRYAIDPSRGMGERITDLEINGEPMDPKRKYVVASWADVNEPQDGPQAWDVLADYFRNHNALRVEEPYVPKLKGVSDDNPGMAL
ncbi:thiosulfohydrolase SoxB [Halorhodospira halophila]|uniref:Sulfate thiol esterase SoxB n=1 Tax=Halorhodospira halophila (strain DSM 244 / SL1) TaxID=349124 RepID=A1WYE1_HALHL|nr:thiosulfohydrolase SoxB [Halorhodospira halophila]ABM62703.1 sulfate thiol esterase SoxB [Halorhodospira halophila SL1]MBK1728384.1 thiosulfohydrolase SoxB [Halorhodospira halophila]